MPNSLSQTQQDKQAALNSPWLVRLLCDECGCEHYRYFDKTRNYPLTIIQGQCRNCFDEIQLTMTTFNMLPCRVGQHALLERLGTTHVFHSSPDFYTTSRSRHAQAHEMSKVVTEIKIQLNLDRNKQTKYI